MAINYLVWYIIPTNCFNERVQLEKKFFFQDETHAIFYSVSLIILLFFFFKEDILLYKYKSNIKSFGGFSKV